MLPAHLQVSRDGGGNESDSSSEVEGHSKRGRRPIHNNNNSQQPPLGLTGVLCDSHKLSIPQRGTLHYTIFRPRNMQPNMPPPLLCIAGGPLLPWSYLSPIVHIINDRSIIFFDPLGVGQSKPFGKIETTNVSGIVQDLIYLVSKLSMKQFHMLGHSFGGIIAFEYLCQTLLQDDSAPSDLPTCLSVVLSNTPVSVAKTLESCQSLMEDIQKDFNASDLDEDMVKERFAFTHECRVRPLPLPLQQSYEMAGFYSFTNSLLAVKDYVAAQPQQEVSSPMNMPPALVLRGQHDFVVDANAWSDLFRSCEQVVLAGCSHYALLENEDIFGSVLSLFLRKYDPRQEDFFTLPNGVIVRK